jgi:muramoyltetrapeptide carboxypeptidase
MESLAMLVANPKAEDDVLVPKNHRITTLRGGRARGPLAGGNLAMLSAMAGPAYWPRFDGAVLFLKDVNE